MDLKGRIPFKRKRRIKLLQPQQEQQPQPVQELQDKHDIEFFFRLFLFVCFSKVEYLFLFPHPMECLSSCKINRCTKALWIKGKMKKRKSEGLDGK